MNKYNELIGQLVEYRTETWKNEPNPVALGLIVETKVAMYEDPYIRIEWLVNPHDYTLFNISEINKFGLTLKDSPEWRD
jgi:hypothetical protein